MINQKSLKVFIALSFLLVSQMGLADFSKDNLTFIHEGEADRFPVVVIDSGVDYTHPDLAPLIHNNKITEKIYIGPHPVQEDRYGWDFNDSDAFAYDNNYSYTPKFTELPKHDPGQDFKTTLIGIGRSLLKNTFEILKATVLVGAPGHGTHVSGIILDHCDSCSIVPIKIFGKTDLTIASLSAAIEYTHRRGHRLVNMSMGVNTKYLKEVPSEQRYLKEVLSKMKDYDDILFVVAAGNEGAYLSELQNEIYPAMLDLPNVITVGAVDQGGKLAAFSNYDPKYIDIFAPGVAINSTWIDGTYKKVSGTSMATPKVTGMIGNLWSQNKELTPLQIKTLFLSNVPLRKIQYKDLPKVTAPILK